MAGREMELRVPFVTLLKIALTILLVLIVVKLWPVILMLIIAVLLAVMLDPIPVWLERFGVRRGYAAALIAVVMLAVLVLFIGVVVPSIVKQVGAVSKEVPKIMQRVTASYPPAAAIFQQAKQQQPQQMKGVIRGSLTAGMFVLEGLTALIFVMVVAIYLLLEGRTTYVWLVSFAPENQRKKFDSAGREIGGVVLAYMRGNVITSLICGVVVFTFLTALGIPAPLLLASIAFLVDFIPVIGIVVMMVPSVLLALMISPGRAFAVIVAFSTYHIIENYVIVPRVYGKQMKVSTLTVIVSVAIGGVLQGVIGALLALPAAAAYPIIERIWLRDKLPEDTVPIHEALERGEEAEA